MSDRQQDRHDIMLCQSPNRTGFLGCSARRKQDEHSNSCSASLTPPAHRAPRLRPARPGWMGLRAWMRRSAGTKLPLHRRPARLSSLRYDQRKGLEDLRIRSSLGSPLRLDDRRAERSRVEDTQEARRARQDDAGYGLRSRLLGAPTGSKGNSGAASSFLPYGRGQEVDMNNTTNRKTLRSERRVVRPTAPWSFGLHRRIAAAATVGAIYAFSLQMRGRHTNHGCTDPANRENSLSSGFGSEGKCQDAERREESP